MTAYFVDTWYFVARLDRGDVHHHRAQRLGARLMNAHLVTHDAVLSEVLAYAARPDKAFSHVDCMSMVLMQNRGIQHVLTNDHHFAQAGFTLVNQ